MASKALSRRTFFSRAGTLVVGFTLAPSVAQMLATPGSQILATPAHAAAKGGDLGVSLDASHPDDLWLEVSAETPGGTGTVVTIYSGKVELGTGIQTAMTQIVAEELYVNFAQIQYVQGDTSQTPGDKGFTAGSKSIQNQGPPLRRAAATAYQTLLSLAAQRLGAPVTDLRARDGRIGIGDQLQGEKSYGQLIGDQQIHVPNNATVAVKDPAAHTVVGQPVQRVDLPEKVRADFTYVSDLIVPDMLHGRVVRPAGRNASFVGFVAGSREAVEATPGVIKVVQQGSFVGVVATSEWGAIQAAKALKVTWQQGAPLPAQASLAQYLQDPANIYQANDAQINVGNVDGALASAAKTVEATYFSPYQMHAAVAPSCAVADVRSAPDATGVQATIWSGTQGPYPLQTAISQLLGLNLSAVRVNYVEAAGCYGHNGADDVSGDAALLSKAVLKPVRVQWSRQDEHGWEPLGPAMVHKMKGGLDASGAVSAWQHTVFTPTHNARPGGAGSLLAGQAIGLLPPALPNKPTNAGTRNAPITYTFTNNRLIANHVRVFATAATSGGRDPASPLTNTLLRSTALRSLGGFSNSFANESFMDELAVAAGKDPLAFRMASLSDPRATAVLQAMADKAGWTGGLSPAPSGLKRGRGIAYQRYELVETYVATYAEVLVNPNTGGVQVTRVVVAHDCGQIINPDGLRNQIEGNVMQGISRTLHEEVTFDQNGVTSVIWAPNQFLPGQLPYSVLHFVDAPTVDIVLIDRPTEVPWGAGEPAIGTVGSAIGNAIFSATGARLRTLPLTPDRVKAAILAS